MITWQTLLDVIEETDAREREAIERPATPRVAAPPLPPPEPAAESSAPARSAEPPLPRPDSNEAALPQRAGAILAAQERSAHVRATAASAGGGLAVAAARADARIAAGGRVEGAAGDRRGQTATAAGATHECQAIGGDPA